MSNPRLAAVVCALAGSCGSAARAPTQADVTFAAERWPGTTLATLNQGKALYVRRCGTCHALYDPEERAEPGWRASLAEMRERARVKPTEEDLILKYLVAVGGAGRRVHVQ